MQSNFNVNNSNQDNTWLNIANQSDGLEKQEVFVPFYLSCNASEESLDSFHFKHFCTINNTKTNFNFIKEKLLKTINSNEIITISNKADFYTGINSAILAVGIKIQHNAIEKKPKSFKRKDHNCTLDDLGNLILRHVDEKDLEISKVFFGVYDFIRMGNRHNLYTAQCSSHVFSVSCENALNAIQEEEGKEGKNRAVLYKKNDKIIAALIFEDGQKVDFALEKSDCTGDFLKTIRKLKFPNKSTSKIAMTKIGENLLGRAITKIIENNFDLLNFQNQLIHFMPRNLGNLSIKEIAITICNQQDEEKTKRGQSWSYYVPKTAKKMKEITIEMLAYRVAQMMLKGWHDNNSPFSWLPIDIIRSLMEFELNIQHQEINQAILNPIADPFILLQAHSSMGSPFFGLPKDVIFEILSRWLKVEPEICKNYTKN